MNALRVAAAIGVLVASCVACALLFGCRTAGTADQTARLNWRNVTVAGSVYVGDGDRTLETTQSAGKEVGVSGLAAQATDNAVGVGGGTASKGAGGTAVLEGPKK